MAFENPANVTGSLPEGFSTTTLTTLLPAFTGLQGWLTLSLIGCVFGICQRVAPQAWDAIVDSFWITIEFHQVDRSYRGCLLATPALMPPLPWPLTTHCPCRLDDVVAFATSDKDKGKEPCNQNPTHYILGTAGLRE